MAWRASYSVLLEIFPQVDTRIIKGAALDHGDDLGSAADFILNEVLVPDEGIFAQEELAANTLERSPFEFFPGLGNAGDRSLTESISGAECSSRSLNSEFSDSTHENGMSYSKDCSDVGQEAITGLAPTCWIGGIHGVSSRAEDEAVSRMMSCESFEVTSANVDTRPIEVHKTVAAPQLLPDSELGGEFTPRNNLCASLNGEADKSEELLCESSAEINIVKAESTDDETRDSFAVCGLEPTNFQGVLETEERIENLGDVKEIHESICVGSTYTDPEKSNMEDLRDLEDLEEETTRNSVYDSVLISSSNIEDGTVLEENGMDMMASTKISFDEDDETEGGCWETVSNTSTQMVSMETLLDAVEQAKADKEVLISSIEELRALRHKTDQEEYAARAAKDEAEKGGWDIMAQVVEMREMLSRAREANEVHAAEVHGEKAVLATEARELRSRLVQLKRDKEKALSVLNEIKASLHARIDKACQERESAVAEKADKEALARECLTKEEAFMAKVAKESRELQAETETCNMLREFLIERGNIVDALQGEVAVLCEDAEELKEEIERMSLSCSSGYVHMLKPRPRSDSSHSSLSRSGKSVVSGEDVAHFLEGVDEVDFALDGDVVPKSPARPMVVGQRNASDKRLPSLRRALSGSQDLSGSSHSSINGMAGAANSGVSSRSINKISLDIGDDSRHNEEKFSSPRSSQSGSEAERKLYQAHIAMFPNEESDILDYRTSNLDIFRTESPRTTKRTGGASSDEDDWHLLELTLGSKHTSSESSSSSFVGK